MPLRVKISRRGARELLKAEAVRADLERRAAAIARAAGPGMEHDSIVGRNRARATVWTDTPEAMAAEARNRKLTSAIDAGRE